MCLTVSVFFKLCLVAVPEPDVQEQRNIVRESSPQGLVLQAQNDRIAVVFF